jgi:hypothetical protein
MSLLNLNVVNLRTRNGRDRDRASSGIDAAMSGPPAVDSRGLGTRLALLAAHSPFGVVYLGPYGAGQHPTTSPSALAALRCRCRGAGYRA